ncbi:MAG: cobalamin-dependent protein, partial [Flavobacteriaceae bacterium]|nr:cobalamin-dependent protein [Flavobacteriaceae bacterium]
KKKKKKKKKFFFVPNNLGGFFPHPHGRRPRILLAKIGQDGHDRGIKIVATSLADMGFDVDLGPLFQTAEGVAKQAVENDVHLIGISSLAGGHKTIIKDLHNSLKKQGATSIKIVMGGIIPEKDKKELIDSGACAFFGPGSRMTETALSLLDILLE